MNFNNFSQIPIKYDWSFSDKTIKDTSHITHGYYTYPAKFIPQLVARIIKENSHQGDIVIDPFMGSGTTLVEAIINNRIAIGTDINEIAILVAKVKTTPIDHNLLLNELANLICAINLNSQEAFEDNNNLNLPIRIDYWFKPHIKKNLLLIMNNILKISNHDIRDFFLVSFAQILKSCSIWLQKSIKPTRDLTKKEINPITKFEWQTNKMIKKHKEFNQIIRSIDIKNIEKYRIIKNNSAKNLSCYKEKATLIVTSPPYVTSYEYADLHQLPLLWLGFLKDLPSFRKKFIGSSFRKRDKINLKSDIAYSIIKQLHTSKKNIEVENYFADMLESFMAMKNVLKKSGRVAIVIGNTKIKGIDILNAEVFQQQFENIGFKTHDIIHREIPSKMLPSTRDPKNGRFTKVTNSTKIMVYPTEYVLIMEKI